MRLVVIFAALISLGVGRNCRIPDIPVPGPTPTPTPVPIPRPTPTPTPPLDVNLDIPHGPGWRGPISASPRLAALVNGVMSTLFGCEAGSRCVVSAVGGWTAYNAGQRAVALELRKHGYRAGFHVPDGVDELCVYETMTSEQCEGYKVMTDGGKIVVAWAGIPDRPCVGEECREVGGGSYRGNWTYAEATPTPTPEPTPGPTPTPVVDECPDTPAANTGVIHCHVKPANQNMTYCDWSPKVNNRDWCARWNNPRTMVVCPLRPEGHPERRACDYKLGLPTWINADAVAGDPFHANAGRGQSVAVVLPNGARVEAVTP